jgi:hypothetical protein
VSSIIRLSCSKITNDLGRAVFATSRATFGSQYVAIAWLDIPAAKVHYDPDIVLVSAGG